MAWIALIVHVLLAILEIPCETGRPQEYFLNTKIVLSIILVIVRYVHFCCSDIDDCTPDPCMNGATCVNGVDSFNCTCAAGYTGNTCETGRRHEYSKIALIRRLF